MNGLSLYTYTIRPMEVSDVPTVVAIERRSFPSPWLPSYFLHELTHSPHSYYYVLLKPQSEETAPYRPGWRRWLDNLLGIPGESEVIGYVGFKLRNTRAHISTIAVHPAWRGQGLGELLLLTALEKALELKAKKVSLEVRPSNRIAQRLYQKYGFRFERVYRGYYRDGEDAWRMEVQVDLPAYRSRLVDLRQTLESRVRCRQVGVGQKSGDTI